MKKFAALLAALSLLAAQSAVFADETTEKISVDAEITDTEETTTEEIEITEEVEENSTDENTTRAAVPSYIMNVAAVTEINDGKISVTLDKNDAENPDNTINFTVSENTLVYTSNGEEKTLADIEVDADITVFSDSYAPAPLILPPQYQADVIIINDGDGFVNVDTYLLDGDMLVNAANTLEFKADDEIEIIYLNEGDSGPENKDLIVFYTSSTKSIPAQTAPSKVVVIGENETALTQIAAANGEIGEITEETPAPEVTDEPAEEVTSITVNDDNTITVKNTVEESFIGITITNTYMKNETLMVPLRAAAEALGFTVGWDGENKTVLINEIGSFIVGENSFTNGTDAFTLSEAAEIGADDYTYVPVEYFETVWGIEIR